MRSASRIETCTNALWRLRAKWEITGQQMNRSKALKPVRIARKKTPKRKSMQQFFEC